MASEIEEVLRGWLHSLTSGGLSRLRAQVAVRRVHDMQGGPKDHEDRLARDAELLAAGGAVVHELARRSQWTAAELLLAAQGMGDDDGAVLREFLRVELAPMLADDEQDIEAAPPLGEGDGRVPFAPVATLFERLPQLTPRWGSLTPDQRGVLQALDRGRLTTGKAAKAAEIENTPAKRALKVLADLGLAKHHGGRKGYSATPLGLSILLDKGQ